MAGTDTPVTVVLRPKASPLTGEVDLTAAMTESVNYLGKRNFIMGRDDASLRIEFSSSVMACPGLSSSVRQYKLKLSAFDNQTQASIAETTIIPNCSDRPAEELGPLAVTIFFTNRAYERARDDFFDQIRRHSFPKQPVASRTQPAPLPQGTTSLLPTTDEKRGVRLTAPASGSAAAATIRIGKYHALIVAAQHYTDQKISSLRQPLSDAQKLSDLLTRRYNFSPANVILLKDPSRETLTATFEKFLTTLGETDNLLIFYAGHGLYDEKLKQGYWLLSDAQRNNRGTWVSNADIRDFISGIPTKHTLLITDACFSGGIFRTRDAGTGTVTTGFEEQLYKYNSRKALTSGNLKEVPDQSVFMEYLLKRLEQNNSPYLPVGQLFYSFKDAVINNSVVGQLPQFGTIQNTGDEGGEFIFVLKK
ncbi:hypothetical protein GCM10027190_12390 [Spirosoma areae]